MKLYSLDTYEKAALIYSNFLKTWADYFKNLKLELPELILYVDYVFKMNYFSLGKIEYYNPKIDLALDEEFLGFRVVSGKTACRHNAKFFKDMFKRIGYNAYYIQGIQMTQRAKDSGYHAICGINKGKNAYLYDPTWHTFLNYLDCSEEEQYFIYKIVNCLLKLYKTSLKNVFALNGYEGCSFILEQTTENKEFVDLIKNMREFDIKKENKYNSSIPKLYEKEEKKLKDTFLDMQDNMQELIKLEKKLVPHCF